MNVANLFQLLAKYGPVLATAIEEFANLLKARESGQAAKFAVPPDQVDQKMKECIEGLADCCIAKCPPEQKSA